MDKAIKASYRVDCRKGDTPGICYQNIIDRLTSSAKKASNEERKKALKQFKKDAKEKKTVHKAELVGHVEKTATVGGKV